MTPLSELCAAGLFLLQCMKVKSESEVAQSCPTRSDPMDCSLPGSSAHGIFQARVLEWVVISSSSGPHFVRITLGEAKDLAILSNCDAYLLEPTEWSKGSQPSSSVWREDSGLLSRRCRKRRPSAREDGGVSGVSSSCGARGGFLPRHDEDLMLRGLLHERCG